MSFSEQSTGTPFRNSILTAPIGYGRLIFGQQYARSCSLVVQEWGISSQSPYLGAIESSLQIADTFRRTVRSSGGGKSSRPANHSIISRTSSPWLAGMP